MSLVGRAASGRRKLKWRPPARSRPIEMLPRQCLMCACACDVLLSSSSLARLPLGPSRVVSCAIYQFAAPGRPPTGATRAGGAGQFARARSDNESKGRHGRSLAQVAESIGGPAGRSVLRLGGPAQPGSALWRARCRKLVAAQFARTRRGRPSRRQGAPARRHRLGYPRAPPSLHFLFALDNLATRPRLTASGSGSDSNKPSQVAAASCAIASILVARTMSRRT